MSMAAKKLIKRIMVFLISTMLCVSNLGMTTIVFADEVDFPPEEGYEGDIPSDYEDPAGEEDPSQVPDPSQDHPHPHPHPHRIPHRDRPYPLMWTRMSSVTAR